MKKRLMLTGVVVACLCQALFAEDLYIDYLEGVVDIKDGNSWFELYIGDELSENDIIRLDAEALVEIAGSNTVIKVIKPGTYNVSDLISHSGVASSAKIGNLISGRLNKLTQDQKEGRSVVGGVRASEAVVDDFAWAGGEDVGELLDEAKDWIAEGEFDEAVYVLEEAYDYAGDYDLGMVLFYLGYANYMRGTLKEADDAFREITSDDLIESDNPFYADYIITYGSLLVETFSFEEAVSFLKNAKLEDNSLQTWYLLLGMGYSGTGNTAGARQNLREAVALDPNSDIGQTAQLMLSEM